MSHEHHRKHKILYLDQVNNLEEITNLPNLPIQVFLNPNLDFPCPTDDLHKLLNYILSNFKKDYDLYYQIVDPKNYSENLGIPYPIIILAIEDPENPIIIENSAHKKKLPFKLF